MTNHTELTARRLKGIRDNYPAGSDEALKASYMLSSLEVDDSTLEPIEYSGDFEDGMRQIVSDTQSISSQGMEHINLHGMPTNQEDEECLNASCTLGGTMLGAYGGTKDGSYRLGLSPQDIESKNNAIY